MTQCISSSSVQLRVMFGINIFLLQKLILVICIQNAVLNSRRLRKSCIIYLLLSLSLFLTRHHIQNTKLTFEIGKELQILTVDREGNHEPRNVHREAGILSSLYLSSFPDSLASFVCSLLSTWTRQTTNTFAQVELMLFKSQYQVGLYKCYNNFLFNFLFSLYM